MRLTTAPAWVAAALLSSLAAASTVPNVKRAPVPYKVQTPPLDTDWTYEVAPAGAPAGTPAVPRFPDGTRLVEVGAGGQRLRGAHDGTSVFLGRNAAGQPDATTGVFAALRDLEAAMRAPDTGGISAALGAVDAAFGGVQAHVGEVGARQNAAEVVTAGLAALDQSLTRQKAELSEVDAAEAFTEAVARQTAYQAAMLASSRVMGLSLADYLR